MSLEQPPFDKDNFFNRTRDDEPDVFKQTLEALLPEQLIALQEPYKKYLNVLEENLKGMEHDQNQQMGRAPTKKLIEVWKQNINYAKEQLIKAKEQGESFQAELKSRNLEQAAQSQNQTLERKPEENIEQASRRFLTMRRDSMRRVQSQTYQTNSAVPEETQMNEQNRLKEAAKALGEINIKEMYDSVQVTKKTALGKVVKNPARYFQIKRLQKAINEAQESLNKDGDINIDTVFAKLNKTIGKIERALGKEIRPLGEASRLGKVVEILKEGVAGMESNIKDKKSRLKH